MAAREPFWAKYIRAAERADAQRAAEETITELAFALNAQTWFERSANDCA